MGLEKVADGVWLLRGDFRGAMPAGGRADTLVADDQGQAAAYTDRFGGMSQNEKGLVRLIGQDPLRITR